MCVCPSRSKNSGIFWRAKHAVPFQIKYIIQKRNINLLGSKTLREKRIISRNSVQRVPAVHFSVPGGFFSRGTSCFLPVECNNGRSMTNRPCYIVLYYKIDSFLYLVSKSDPYFGLLFSALRDSRCPLGLFLPCTKTTVSTVIR